MPGSRGGGRRLRLAVGPNGFSGVFPRIVDAMPRVRQEYGANWYSISVWRVAQCSVRLSCILSVCR